MTTLNLISRLGLGALTLCMSLAAMAQQNFAPQGLRVDQIRDDVYVISNSMSGNVTVLVTDEGVLLVDDKFENDHDAIMARVREITDQPIVYVVNTHFHGDHTGGNVRMQSLGAHIVASENARRMMVETNAAGLPNVTLDEHLRIYIGGVPVDLYYFGRGHTDGDVVLHFPEHDLAVMGDLFAAYNPFTQLVHYAGGGSARAWTGSIDKALKLDFETVVPGHAPVTDRAMLEAFRDDTLRLQNMMREMTRQKRSRDDIAAMLKSEFGWSDFLLERGLDGIIAEMSY